ncbi:hypothetical protein A225_3245 [Klebsiella michiganensis E718]|nr:hypothetical protein A225_3245 [Klebsiella michiganensis E718]
MVLFSHFAKKWLCALIQDLRKKNNFKITPYDKNQPYQLTTFKLFRQY